MISTQSNIFPGHVIHMVTRKIIKELEQEELDSDENILLKLEALIPMPGIGFIAEISRKEEGESETRIFYTYFQKGTYGIDFIDLEKGTQFNLSEYCVSHNGCVLNDCYLYMIAVSFAGPLKASTDCIYLKRILTN